MTPDEIRQDREAMVAQIEADRAAGTPGPWVVRQTVIHGVPYGKLWVEGIDPDDERGERMLRISGSGGARSYTREIVSAQDHDDNDVNARRIARVPQLEDAYLTHADEIAILERVFSQETLDELTGKIEALTVANAALQERVEELEKALAPFAVQWSGLSAANDEDGYCATVLYSGLPPSTPKDELNMASIQRAEDHETDMPKPLDPEACVFGVEAGWGSLHGSFCVPVLQAKHFAAAYAALEKRYE